MLHLANLVIGVKLTEKMEKANIFERVKAAKTAEEKTAIIQETEKMAIEAINVVFKSDEEIATVDPKGLELKHEVLQSTIEYTYVYFGLESPFKNGVTLNDVLVRNGYGSVGLVH